MAKFKFYTEETRTIRTTTSFEVEAKTEKEAEEIATMAAGTSFGEYEAKYPTIISKRAEKNEDIETLRDVYDDDDNHIGTNYID